MNFRTLPNWMFVTTLAGIGLIAANTKSQEPDPKPLTFERVENGVIRVESSDLNLNGNPFASATAAAAVAKVKEVRSRTSIADTTRKLAKAVLSANDANEKTVAEDELKEQLGKYFDDDMTQRKEELAKIEERLTKLRELLDRRRTKKQEIVDLQVKVALNEADGLGFYNTENQEKGGGFGWSGPQIRLQTASPVEVSSSFAVPAPPALPAAPSTPATPAKPATPSQPR